MNQESRKAGGEVETAKPERVQKAAIRFENKIFVGHRHCDIFNANAVIENGVIISSIAAGEQGFVSESGEFLTREAAAVRALKCGQIPRLKFSRTKLFSEDLY